MAEAIARAIGFVHVRPFVPVRLFRLIAVQLYGETITTRVPRK